MTNTKLFDMPPSASFMPEELRARCEQTRRDIHEWSAERASLAEKLETTIEVPARNITSDGRALDGQRSWIRENTFDAPETALEALASLQRQRVAIPVRGLALAREIEALREAVQAAWAKHAQGLEKALSAAEAKARATAKKLPISEALRERHVQETTVREREAAKASNPCPPDWLWWNDSALSKAQKVLLTELRAAFASALR